MNSGESYLFFYSYRLKNRKHTFFCVFPGYSPEYRLYKIIREINK